MSTSQMPEPHQLSLLDSEETSIDRTFASAVRHTLDEDSWVEFIPGWLTGNERVFHDVTAAVEFEQRSRWMYTRRVQEPRLTAEWPSISSFPVPSVRIIAEELSLRYRIRYDNLWLNFYRDERDGTGWHGDWPSVKRERSVVPVLSLGAARTFLIKPRAGGPSISLTPSGGDLIVMGGRCQRDWRHSIPKRTRSCRPRISINFQSTYQMIRPR
jgi:alkylated DNA repair dioxygenase AlkB